MGENFVMKEAEPRLTRSSALALLLVWGIPVLPVILFILEWLVACATLGHIPIGGLEDPKSISAFSSILHSLTSLSLLLFVPMQLIVIRASWSAWKSATVALAVCGSGILMMIGSFAVLGAFPWDAMGWWLD